MKLIQGNLKDSTQKLWILVPDITLNSTFKRGNKIQFEVTHHDMGDELMNSMNLWAKEHLKQIDEQKKCQVIIKYYPDGRYKHEEITLKEFLKKVNKA